MKDPQLRLLHMSNSKRLREASSTIRGYLKGRYQRIGECRELQPQRLLTTLQCIEDSGVMDDQTVPAA